MKPGSTHSPETRAKMSSAHGKTWSPARRAAANVKYSSDEERREARRQRSADWYLANRALSIARSIANYTANRAAALAQRRVNKLKGYGLTPEQFQAHLEAQGGVCAICKGPPVRDSVFSVDHDHVTKKVRGLLCRKCNAGIGQLRDDPKIVQAALEYLTNGT